MKKGTGQINRKFDFVSPAERAFKRVARQLRKEHKLLGLPLILGEGNRVRRVWVR